MGHWLLPAPVAQPPPPSHHPPARTPALSNAQAEAFGGRILLAYEVDEAGHVGELSDRWQSISGPDDVQTPADVYASLTQEGFAVHYCRVPVTDGTSPSVRGRRQGEPSG